MSHTLFEGKSMTSSTMATMEVSGGQRRRYTVLSIIVITTIMRRKNKHFTGAGAEHVRGQSDFFWFFFTCQILLKHAYNRNDGESG